MDQSLTIRNELIKLIVSKDIIVLWTIKTQHKFVSVPKFLQPSTLSDGIILIKEKLAICPF
jgi:hypothetical protein